MRLVFIPKTKEKATETEIIKFRINWVIVFVWVYFCLFIFNNFSQCKLIVQMSGFYEDIFMHEHRVLGLYFLAMNCIYTYPPARPTFLLLTFLSYI